MSAVKGSAPPFDMVRIDGPRRGSTPFFFHNGELVFESQGGREISYGHTFSADRGYRVYFCFADSPAINTWGAPDLLRWAQKIVAEDDAQAEIKKVAIRLANQVIRLNREWEDQGRPRTGIITTTEGTA